MRIEKDYGGVNGFTNTTKARLQMDRSVLWMGGTRLI